MCVVRVRLQIANNAVGIDDDGCRPERIASVLFFEILMDAGFLHQAKRFSDGQRFVEPEFEIDFEELRDPACRLEWLRRHENQPRARIVDVLVVLRKILHLLAAEPAAS